MLAETLLACWFIACVFVPLVLAVTREPSVEVRRVTNALVLQRASLVAASEPAVIRIRTTPDDLARRRAAHGELDRTLTARGPVFAVEVAS